MAEWFSIGAAGMTRRAIPALAERTGRYQFAGAFAVAALLIAATLVRYGYTADGMAWSLCQLFLVVIAWMDLRTRTIRSGSLVFAAGAFVALRSVYAPDALPQTISAGLIGLMVFFLLGLLLKGGLGMGDVELVGLLGVMLGADVLFALMTGCLAGSVAALTLVVSRRASLRTTFAYGPYLALGASLAIVFASPPPLV
jgi:prepilin signal peptidase PulO-like enzyme (type II secretory pathway)